MLSKINKALTVVCSFLMISPLLAMDPPTQPIQPFPKNHSIIIPKDQSLCSSLTKSFANSADMAYLTALLQKRDKICEDILNPIFTQMLESRRIQSWKYLKSQYDIESSLYQESLATLRFYWKDEAIRTSKLEDAGFGWEEAFNNGPFSYLSLDLRIEIIALATNHTLLRLRWNYIGVCLHELEDFEKALGMNQTLTSLELGFCGIGEYSAQYLARALKKNHTLRSLNFWGNWRLNSIGVQYLAGALEENDALTDLNFDNDDIGSIGAQHFAEALRKNKTLMYLSLMRNKIGDLGAYHLAGALEENKTLTDLNLSSDDIGDSGAQRLAEALTKNETLTNLNLTGNKIGTLGAQHLAEALIKNKTLMYLSLMRNKIGDEAAKFFAEFKDRVCL